MTVSIIDVAEHILTEQGEMSTMKLQKLLYFSQGWALAWTGVPLFVEEFEAWASGPVCRELYELHRGEYSVGPGFFYAKLAVLAEIQAAEDRVADEARNLRATVAIRRIVGAVSVLIMRLPAMAVIARMLAARTRRAH